MQDLEQLSQRIETIFTRIHEEQMQGIPLLNPHLQVECVGFQRYQERLLGVLITPWMMSLILLPAEGEDWKQLKLGDKQTHRFPANHFTFLANEIEGIGVCQSHSLYSPMHEFANQDHALAAAESFLETLMVAVENPNTDPHDEALLGRILRGEETPELELDGFALSESKRNGNPECAASEEEQCMTRRDLLHGRF